MQAAAETVGIQGQEPRASTVSTAPAGKSLRLLRSAGFPWRRDLLSGAALVDLAFRSLSFVALLSAAERALDTLAHRLLLRLVAGRRAGLVGVGDPIRIVFAADDLDFGDLRAVTAPIAEAQHARVA